MGACKRQYVHFGINVRKRAMPYSLSLNMNHLRYWRRYGVTGEKKVPRKVKEKCQRLDADSVPRTLHDGIQGEWWVQLHSVLTSEPYKGEYLPSRSSCFIHPPPPGGKEPPYYCIERRVGPTDGLDVSGGMRPRWVLAVIMEINLFSQKGGGVN